MSRLQVKSLVKLIKKPHCDPQPATPTFKIISAHQTAGLYVNPNWRQRHAMPMFVQNLAALTGGPKLSEQSCPTEVDRRRNGIVILAHSRNVQREGLIPYLQEAIPWPSSDRHAVFRHSKAAHTVIVASKNACYEKKNNEHNLHWSFQY